jgi:hypothetical protein
MNSRRLIASPRLKTGIVVKISKKKGTGFDLAQELLSDWPMSAMGH